MTITPVAGRAKGVAVTQILLETRGLKKWFPVTKGSILSKVTGWVKAVDGVNISVSKGETFGLVGESGCGKTTLSKLILLLENSTDGCILFEGKDIGHASGNDLKRYRQSVQAVFQDPYSSLSPRLRVGSIIGEPILVNKTLPKEMIKERVAELLEQVGLSQASAELYPHEFSGGQRQRIAMARALAINPQLVILDEPVSALDVSIRAQVMNLVKDLGAKFGLTYLLIAHDLAVVKHMSTRIGVMYLGKLVECTTSEELYSKPVHPYTKALISAALPDRPGDEREEIILSGEVPSPIDPPPGCRFHPRCPYVMPVCSEIEPLLEKAASGHTVACHLLSTAA